MNEIYTFGGRKSSGYDYRINPVTKLPEFHAGSDYAAPAGTPVPSAAAGTVVYSGKNEGLGNVVVVRNLTGDYSLYAHMQDGDRVKLGQKVWQGDPIGGVGSTGKYTTGPHLHYAVIKKEAGETIEKSRDPRDGGPIGIHLDESNTYNPSTYRNYVPPLPAYLDDSRRAAEIISGLEENSPRNGTPAFYRPADRFFSPFGQTIPAPANQNPVADRFGEWGSVPLPNTPAASDDPAGFADRYGNWASWPAGVPGNAGAAAPQPAPDQGKRSETDDTPVRILSRRSVSPAPASVDAPSLSPASASPLLGIFSGKPMRDSPVWPSIFATDNRSSPGDDELYQRWRRFLDA